MARIITAGNETGDWTGDGFTAWAGSPGTAVNQLYPAPSPNNNRGRYSFYLTSGQGIQYDVTNQVPGGIGEFYLRFFINMGGRTDGAWERFRLYSPSGSFILRFLTQDGGSGGTSGGYWYPQIWNSAGSVIESNSSRVYRNIDWVLCEFYVKLSTGSDGQIVCWLNRERVMDYRGQLASAALEDKMGTFRPFYGPLGGGGAAATYYDHIALNDTTGTVNNGRCGAGWILPFWPSGEGSASQLTNTFGTSTDNFKFVNKTKDENPSGFVGTSTVDERDLYTLSPVPDEFHGVNAIRVTAYGVRSGPTITKAKMLLKPPAQAEIDQPSGVGVGITLPTGGADYFYADFESNPNSSNEPFTKDEMDGMEAGIQFIA